MLVIEGFHGKSLAVGEEIKDVSDKKILFIEQDSLRLTKVLNRGYYVSMFEDFDVNDSFIEKIEEMIYYYNETHNFSHVVMYLNTKKEFIPRFKEIEERCGVNIILTVQVHADESQDPIKKYIV